MLVWVIGSNIHEADHLMGAAIAFAVPRKFTRIFLSGDFLWFLKGLNCSVELTCSLKK